MKLFCILNIFLVQLLCYCSGFYLPGLAPVQYCPADSQTGTCKSNIHLFVNRLDSIESVIPYDYSKFDFCHSKEENHSPTENLGQVVFGERIHPSSYDLTFNANRTCSKLCERTYKKDDVVGIEKLDFLKKGIGLNYQHHWIIDNMPVTWCYEVAGEDKQIYCSTGFPVGCYVNPGGIPKDACVIDSKFSTPDTYYIFNHVDITLKYHSGSGEEWEGARLVSAAIVPRSFEHKNGVSGCSGEGEPMGIPSKVESDITVKYTYSVTFEKDDSIKWASRWDYILKSMAHSKIHWFSIINSLGIVLFLSGMVGMILLRTLHRDTAQYKQLVDVGEDVQEEFGWKSIHGDVFCPPRFGMLLTVCLGIGSQVGIMVTITLGFACLGFLSPANRGAFSTCILVLFVCLGTTGGYIAARIYKMIGGEKWKSNAMLTAFLFPGIIFGLFFLLNLMLWTEDSSAAIPFSTLVALLALWFGISVPLTFLGAYLGFKKRAIEPPVKVNQIPRQIPEQTIYRSPLSCMVMGGILPFGCIFIQLFFILNSIWSHQIYYMFGFLFLVFLILVITCSETAILLCFFHLCSEDYRWWWRSFLTSGFTGVYLFIYSVRFFFSNLTIVGTTSTFLYFGYTGIMVLLFTLLTGTIGFFACFLFIRKIYEGKEFFDTQDTETDVESLITFAVENETVDMQCGQ